jgi:exopolysaccharide production protein ExoZ
MATEAIAHADAEKLSCLQAGRGIAATAVLLYHANIAATDFSGETWPALTPLLSRGYLGVDFFFVLSGFILTYSYASRPWAAEDVGAFAYKRLGRIFLPYLPVGLAMAGAYTLLPALGDGDRVWSWPSSLTLLPVGGEPALVVAWTLQLELAFYAIFAALLLSRRLVPGLAVWAALIALAAAVPELSSPLVFRSLNAEFVFGAVAALLVGDERSRSALLLAMAALALAGFALLGASEHVRLLFGLGLALLLPPVVRAESAGHRAPRAFVALGGASYSIYLVHIPILSVVDRVAGPFGWAACMAAGIGAALVGGFVYWAAWERPSLRRWLQHRHRWRVFVAEVDPKRAARRHG